MNLLIDAAIALVAFGGGALYGDKRSVSVERAIATVTNYETQAKNTLARIFQHKTEPVAPVTVAPNTVTTVTTTAV